MRDDIGGRVESLIGELDDRNGGMRGTRVGINGFGRMGRLALRAAPDGPRSSSRWSTRPQATPPPRRTCSSSIPSTVDGRTASTRRRRAGGRGREIAWSLGADAPARSPWEDAGVELVLECSGRFRTIDSLAPYFERGVRKVIVAAPVKEHGALNVVVGVNDDPAELARHDIVTAASCTTNCLAPVVKVLHEGIGIEHGSITTLHDMTNTQVVVDAPHKDLRRARASSLSLIPTTTGSATAIGLIFPELQGKLNGLAVRVPLLNASLTDCVFEVARATDDRGGQPPARGRQPTGRSPGSSATRPDRSSPSTTATTRAPASSTPPPRWSWTKPR